jgi:hypothetical protein
MREEEQGEAEKKGSRESEEQSRGEAEKESSGEWE